MEIDPTVVAGERQRVQKRAAELSDLLREFNASAEIVAADEVSRFEALCAQMFGNFVCPDAEVFPDGPPMSNLDTGDPIPGVYPPFADALRDECAAVDADGHHYYGPEATGELAASARHFLETRGFANGAPLAELAVLPGAGTVHIYDALCKTVVEVPDDTVVVPELGYGFFLTQPHRVGGRVVAARCDDRGRVTAEALAEVVDRHNRELWQGWVRDREVLFGRAARRLGVADPGLREGGRAGALVELREAMASAPGAWRSAEVRALLAEVLGRPGGRWADRVLGALRPPRVVAFLHIQPAVSGHVYRAGELSALAEVLSRSDVVALEDVAYHSIRCALGDLPSLQPTPAVTHTMLGLSKPLAVANFRLGLLFTGRDRAERVQRALESTTGYVSTALQRALASALAADGYDSYAEQRSWGPDGYDHRGRVMRGLLVGDRSDEVRRLVRRQAARNPELRPFAEGLLDTGLSRWLRPFNQPETGFFQLVSCEPMVGSEVFRRLGVRTSFDVFALFAYVFGVRTIPEEGMRPGSAPGRLLRLAFSVDPETTAGLFLRAHAGLTLLEEG